MKILRLRIKNINSLRLDQWINFADLNNYGLFLITGPTGAGKTTLLDAITLALYGKTPRMTEASERKGEMLMSHGEYESAAELEFEVANKQYRAKWLLTRAHKRKDGNFQDSKRELADISQNPEGIPLGGHRKSDIDTQIVQITGLTYEQFCRSVLLPQGDFAAFLKSDAEQRSSLLEKITGTEIYSDISKAAHERKKLADEQLKEQKSRLENIQLLSDNQINDLRTQTQNAHNQLTQINANIHTWTEHLNWYTQIETLQNEYDQYHTEALQIEQQILQFQPIQQQIEQHEIATKLQPLLNLLTDSQNTQNELQQQIAHANTQLDQLDQQQNAITQQISQTQTQLDTHKKQEPQLEQTWLQVETLDRNIHNITQDLQKHNDNLQLITPKLQTAQQQHKQLQKDIHDTENTHTKITQWLQKHHVAENLSAHLPQIKNTLQRIDETKQKLAENKQQQTSKQQELNKTSHELLEKDAVAQQIEATTQQLIRTYNDMIPTQWVNQNDIVNTIQKNMDSLRNEIDELRQLDKQCKNIRNLQQSIEQAEQAIQQYRIKSDDLSGNLLSLYEEDTEISNKLQELEDELHKIREQAKISEFKHLLIQGQPCPLCGSKHHQPNPSSQPIQPQPSKLKTEIDTLKNRKEKNNEKKKTYLAEYTQYDQLRQEQEAYVKSHQLRLHELLYPFKETNFRAEIGYLVHKPVLIGERINNLSIFFNDQYNLFNSISQIQAKIKENKDALHIIHLQKTHLTETQTRLKNELSELHNLHTQLHTNLQHYTQTLQQDLQPYRSIITTPQNTNPSIQHLEHLQQRYTHHTDQQTQLNKTLQNHNIELRINTQTLADLQQQHTNHTDQQTQLNKTLQQLQAERNQKMPSETTPQQQRTQYQQRLQHLTNTLNQHTSQKHNIEIRKATTQTSLTEHQKQLDHAQQQYQKTNQELQIQLQKSPFPNIHALQIAIIPPHQLQQYQLQQQQLTQRNTQNNTRLQDTAHKLHRQQQNPPTHTDKQTLQHQKQQANEQILDLQQQIATNNHTLQQNEHLTKQHATLIQHIKNLETQYQPLQQLHDLIGSSDGKKFRAFAQGLTLQHLLRKANQYLQTLSGGRYLFARRTDTPLDIAITDHFDNGIQRSIYNISGGESFLASLALALGLSDMAGKNTRIDSLFIDEGFGTLDNDTRRVALDTLDTLQATGKSIGIISHITELKEHIPHQIEIYRNNQNQSQIRIQNHPITTL